MQMGEQKALLILSDERVGDYIVELIGTTTLPAPSDTWKLQCPSKQSTTKEFQVLPRNPQLEKARNLLLDRLLPNKKRLPPKNRDTINKAFEAVSATAGGLTYKMEYSSPFFSGPDKVVAGAPTAQKVCCCSESCLVLCCSVVVRWCCV